MTFWRNIASLAARRVDAVEASLLAPICSERPGDDPTFSTAVTALGAKLAQQTTHGFEAYAKQLAKRYGGCPLLLEDVMDGLFHIAQSDGAITGDEMTYLARVAELFGFTPLTFRRLRATHLGQEADDPYLILKIAPDASDAELHAAWRAAISEAHPDRARARGLPEDFVEIAQLKAAAINAAHDAALSERRQLALASL